MLNRLASMSRPPNGGWAESSLVADSRTSIKARGQKRHFRSIFQPLFAFSIDASSVGLLLGRCGIRPQSETQAISTPITRSTRV
jgi:hypothetical protein